MRHPWLNLLVLNFGYHNAHHQRASVPWYRLPAYHRSLYGEDSAAVTLVSALFRTWHRNRVRRVGAASESAAAGAEGTGNFGGAHGVSFLTVV